MPVFLPLCNRLSVEEKHIRHFVVAVVVDVVVVDVVVVDVDDVVVVVDSVGLDVVFTSRTILILLQIIYCL